MKTAAPRSPTSWRSISLLLMGMFVLSFIAQQLFIVPKSYHAYLFLSGYGMKSWQLWELFTCQGFHSHHSLVAGVIHLLVNLAGLWFLGRAVEAHLGGCRFLLLYLGSGLIGALAQGVVAATGFLLPDSLAKAADFLIARFGESVGSSIGLCGVFAYFCLWQGRTTTLRLLWLGLALAALLIVIPSDPSLAHLGHFVGLLAGMMFFSLWRRADERVAAANGRA